MERKTTQIFRTICRILVGATFVFSGVVKSVDPLGTAYKLQDYFQAFDMPWLSGAALILAVILSTLELYIGALLLINQMRPFAIWAASIFIFFFTGLTLYLAIENPVHDCGCFGDAIKLTNWETFYKNLILSALCIYLLIGKWKRIWFPWDRPHRQQVFVWCALFILVFQPSIFSLRHLPLIDFRPYAVGSSIPEGMRVPEGMPRDEYRMTFIYEKEGKKQEFTEEDYPWDDSTWTYVSSAQQLVQKGVEPAIKDFALYDSMQSERSAEIFTRPDYQLFIVAPFIESITQADIAKLNSLGALVDSVSEINGVYLLTSSSPDLQQKYAREGLRLEMLTGDERVLKTMIRASPGVMLIHHGVVIGKWALRDAPPASYFRGDLLAKQMTSFRKSRNNQILFWVVFVVVVIAFQSFYSSRRIRSKEQQWQG